MTVAAGQTGYMLAGQELPIQSAQHRQRRADSISDAVQAGRRAALHHAAGDRPRPGQAAHDLDRVDRLRLHAAADARAERTREPMLVNPIIDSREAETAVTIDNGDTLVISGLRMIRTTTRENKIPGLGDVPLLGWLFKNHRSQQQMTDLYFFVTPTLL